MIHQSLSFNYQCTLDSAYNGYNQHLIKLSTFHCTKIIDSNVTEFGYNEHLLTTSNFFWFCLFIESGTQCNYNNERKELNVKITALNQCGLNTLPLTTT